MAYRQVVQFGMSPTIGHISLPHKKPSEPAKRMYSDKLARMIDQVVCILLFDTLYRMMQNGLTKVVTHNMLQMKWMKYAADGAQSAVDACDNGILFASKDWARPEHNNNELFCAEILGNLNLGVINLYA